MSKKRLYNKIYTFESGIDILHRPYGVNASSETAYLSTWLGPDNTLGWKVNYDKATNANPFIEIEKASIRYVTDVTKGDLALVDNPLESIVYNRKFDRLKTAGSGNVISIGFAKKNLDRFSVASPLSSLDFRELTVSENNISVLGNINPIMTPLPEDERKFGPPPFDFSKDKKPTVLSFPYVDQSKPTILSLPLNNVYNDIGILGGFDLIQKSWKDYVYSADFSDITDKAIFRRKTLQYLLEQVYIWIKRVKNGKMNI